MTNREKEKAILDKIASHRTSSWHKDVVELLELRLARYKDTLVTGADEHTRGKALELRDLLKYINGVFS